MAERHLAPAAAGPSTTDSHVSVLHKVSHVHNYLAWRDSFDPYLAELIGHVWADA
jgi:hypothetical protein